MQVPPHVVKWVERNYPRPKVDPEWLSQCYEWLVEDQGHNPATKFNALAEALNHQILESDLTSSMLPGTGLPPQLASRDTTTVLKGPDVLVEIVSITEVASSAFNLNQTRVAIEERKRDGNVDEDGEGEGDIEVEGEGPMPKYARGMLKFQLSDGSVTIPAMEYRSLPQLSIETTPLGFKMRLKTVQIRRGVAFLEPSSVVLIGNRTEDRDINRHKEFARGLRIRMGLPEPPEEVEEEMEDQMQQQQSEVQQVRSPLRDISPPMSPTLNQRNNEDDLENRKRRIPTQGQVQTPDSTSTTLVPTATSRYFGSSGSSGLSSNIAPASSSVDLSLSPPRRNNNIPLFLASPAPSPPPDENFWSDIEMLDAEQENQPQQRHLPQAASMQPPETGGGGANIRLLGKLKEQAEKQGGGSGKGKETAQMTGYISDDYADMSLDIDDDLLDAIEKQAYGGSQPQKTVAPSRAGVSGTSNQPRAINLARTVTKEVITIDDDEEDAFDKENVPVPARNVRRRTEEHTSISAGPPRSQRPPGQPRILAKTESAVIDLSDSD